MKLPKALLTLSIILTPACALLDTDGPAASIAEDDYAAYAAQKSGTTEALDEMGLSPSKRLTSDEREALGKRIQLRRLEKNIASEKEREQYFNFKSYLDNDDERISFLMLPSFESRDRYALQRGIYFKTNKYTPPVKDAVSRSDIILGMTRDAVIESWGEPITVEVAGNQLYGNERWKYVEFISTAEGYQKEERVVIFESGKVVGWQRY